MKKEIIRINNLSYKVKDGDEEKMLLNNISISFEMPEIITISGPSGSGKTTFLYAISGMLDNLKGEIYIEEKNILACTKKQRKKRSKKKSRHYITDKVHSGNYPDPCNSNCHKQKYNPHSRAHKPERKRNHCRGKHMPARPGMSFRIFWNHR